MKVLPEHAVREAENGDSPRLFSALLTLATDVCLTEPLAARNKEIFSEARVVSELGVRGLRAAMDLLQGVTGEGELANYDRPLRHPEEFGDRTDPEVMAQIEAFGEGLLNEAYRCLGPEGEVEERIQAFQQAKNDDEQAKVVEWLHDRLRQMSPTMIIEGKPDETPFYHPARLSPKLIGVYPNQTMRPTCLSISVIAASFLHQAGADMLHAGVMQTRLEFEARQAISFFHQLPQFVETIYGVPLPPLVREALEEKEQGLTNDLGKDIAYHLAVYARLKSGEWIQFDPNFKASCFMADQESAALDKAYKDLNSMSEVAPGLEATVFAPMGTTANLATMMIETGGRELLGTPEAIKAVLLDSSSEELLQKVKQAFIDPFFDAARSTEGLSSIWKEYTVHHTLQKYRTEGIYDNQHEEAFLAMFEKYVLRFRPLDEVLKACHQDEGELWRCIEAIQTLPLTMTAWHVLRNLHNDMKITSHAMVEVGLPATRIGAAVLNDFATHCDYYGDEKLPPSFRLSHWASQVPVTETAQDAEESETQWNVLENNRRWLRASLRYNKAHDI